MLGTTAVSAPVVVIRLKLPLRTVALFKLRPAGKMSVTVTFAAAEGPALNTVKV
jgi:hypothetical protein